LNSEELGGDGKAHGDPHIPLSGTNGSDIKEVMVVGYIELMVTVHMDRY
jgi:hypothetical protein